MLLDLYALGRIAIGVAALVAPTQVATVMGLGDDDDVAMASRMIGGRDVALGLGLAIANRRGASTRGWLEACIAVDAIDGAVAADGVRRGLMTQEQGLLVGGLVLGSVAVGAWLVASPCSKTREHAHSSY